MAWARATTARSTRATCKTDTPYNTYTRDGPAAHADRSARARVAAAAVHPEDTGALYFVATGDGRRRASLLRTLEEHNQAVQAYLAHLRGQPRTPRRT